MHIPIFIYKSEPLSSFTGSGFVPFHSILHTGKLGREGLFQALEVLLFALGIKIQVPW